MFYFALVATLWRTASKYWNNVYNYEECWFAAVSCICLRDFQLFRWWIVYTLSQHFCYCGTRWWNILKLSYEQQRCHSSITSDWWTSYIWNFLLLDEQLHQDIYMIYEARCYSFNYYWWNIFRSSSSSFATWSTNIHHLFTRFVEDFHMKTVAETLNSDWQHFGVISKKLYNIVNCDSQLGIILLLWQPIPICDYPSIPQNVTTFYPLQRTDVFFYNRSNPMGLFYHSTTLPKLFLTTFR